MTGEEWALAASAFFSGLAACSSGDVEHDPASDARGDGRPGLPGVHGSVPSVRGALLGKGFNYVWAAGMTLGPAAALVLLADDPGSTSFILTAIALAIVIGGVLVVSNVWKTPTYNLILGWDPEALPADWEAGHSATS